METTAAGVQIEQGMGQTWGLVAVCVFPEFRSMQLRPGEGPWKIGRSVECSFAVEAPQLSREHAEISLRGPVVALRDLRSTNGTYLNGVRIQQAPLVPGSVFRLGQFVGILLRVPMSSALHQPFGRIGPNLYGGPSLWQVLEPLRRVANSNLPIILEGETGTGKEQVARYIHAASARSGAFQAINCAALPAELAEAQLFGHRAGAFTGAQQAAMGLIRGADEGTLFLDELQELPLAIQAKLLRVLQEGEVTPVGASKSIRVDVRVISACQRSLIPRTQDGSFREDLYSRLAGYITQLPTLSQRIEEIPSLFVQLLKKHSVATMPRVDASLVERLCLHSWPRNVRELEMLARRLLALHASETLLTQAHLPRELLLQEGSRTELDLELVNLSRVLHRCSGNVTQASLELGISRSRVYRLMGGRSVSDLMTQHLAMGAEASGCE